MIWLLAYALGVLVSFDFFKRALRWAGQRNTNGQVLTLALGWPIVFGCLVWQLSGAVLAPSVRRWLGRRAS